jgi:uncharacterized iron-regulated membrane protein
MNAHVASAPKPKNNRLIQFRLWHRWAGLAAALFLLVISLTGMVLNYKKPIFQALGLEPKLPATEGKSAAPASQLAPEPRHAGNVLALPVSFAQALDAARRAWGDAPVERLELKMEQGEWVYKIKRKGGAELWVSAVTGAHFAKSEYEKWRRGPDGAPAKSFDWGKLMLDLHTGKIGGPVGVAIMTGVGGLLFFLTLSGVYLWLKPLLIRRANAAARGSVSEAARPVSAPVPQSTSGRRPAITVQG